MSTVKVFALAATLVICPAAIAQTVVSPTGLDAVEGNSGSRSLFGFINVARYQQVYNANQFTGGPISISGFALRTNGVTFAGLFGGPGTAFSRSLVDAQINLSTTSRDVDGLSNSFVDNIGADAVTVVNRGRITYSSEARSTNSLTRDFDVQFTFDTPFAYDPGQGNLLLDVISFGGGDRSGTTLDAQSALGDGVSSVFRSNGTTGAGTTSTIGYVTQFQFASAGAVPEPAAWALMIGGFGMVGGAMRNRKVATKIAFA